MRYRHLVVIALVTIAALLVLNRYVAIDPIIGSAIAANYSVAFYGLTAAFWVLAAFRFAIRVLEEKRHVAAANQDSIRIFGDLLDALGPAGDVGAQATTGWLLSTTGLGILAAALKGNLATAAPYLLPAQILILDFVMVFFLATSGVLLLNLFLGIWRSPLMNVVVGQVRVPPPGSGTTTQGSLTTPAATNPVPSPVQVQQETK